MSEKQNETEEKNVIFKYFTSDISDKNNGINIIQHLQIPQWIIFVYFGIIACGTFMNLVHGIALIRSRRNGTSSLILQICLVDMASLYVAITEILTLKRQTWFFPMELCPLFKGSEVLINCLTLYLLICFNFHVISLWNLHEAEAKKNGKNPLTSCSDSGDDSNECLVTKQENANRLVTIDYRKRKDDISIVFPTIFIWIISLSLSVPNFTLSSTLRLKENYTLCAVIDVYYEKVLQHSLLVFKIVIPTGLLVISLVFLIFKLSQTAKSDIDILTKKMKEIKKLLIFGIILSVLYILTSLQRQCFHFLHIISCSFSENNGESFKMPPLHNNYLNKSSLILLAMLHYAGGTLRSIACWGILPKFKHLIKTKVFYCCTVSK